MLAIKVRRSAVRTGRRRRLAGVLWASLALALLAPAGASALTYVTDPSIADTDTAVCVAQENSGAACSLRQAIAAADTADGNTVMVSAGTYAITQGIVPGPFVPSHTMTIQGAGAATTIVDGAGNGTQPFLQPGTARGKALSLSGLTIRRFNGDTNNGSAINYLGGAGDLQLSNMVFDHNSGQSGGAVYYLPSSGSLAITSSTFSNNRASRSGGAVYSQHGAATITIDSSTFSSNGAGDAGGALLLVGSTAAAATNSTFAGNSAGTSGGEAIYLAGAGGSSLTLGFDTFTANGPPSGATLEVGNQVVAGSITGTILSGAGRQCALNRNTSFTDGGSNLSSDASCGLTAGGDQQNADARLLPLGSYGGPTQTAALGVGSPAIDAALTCPVPALDQRGIARPQGVACDIGAFEVRRPTLTGTSMVSGTATVGNTVTCVPPTLNAGDGSATTSFTFSRDGVQVATGSTYILTVADQGHAISCTFSATSAGGSVSSPSAAVTVGAPPPASGPGSGSRPGPGAGGQPSNVFTLIGVRALTDGVLAFTVKLPGPGALSVRAETRGGGKASAAKKRKHAKQPKAITYGAASADAGTTTVNVRPTSAARRLLRNGKRLLISATITFTPTGGQPRSITTSGSVRLKKKK